MVAALALTGAILFILTGLALTARLVRIGNLDAMALAEKLAVPNPSSPRRYQEAELELRRRQSLERIRVQLLAEALTAGWRAGAEKGAGRALP